jgi:hypothetical protein
MQIHDHPEINRRAAGLADAATLAPLAADYRAARAVETAEQATATATREALAALDARLIDPATTARGELYIRRAALTAETGLAPRRLGESARRRCLAELALLARISHLGRREFAQARDDYDAVQALRKPLLRALQERTQSTGAEARHTVDIAAIRTTLEPLDRQLTAHQARLDAARDTAALAEARAALRYGDDIALDQPHTWERAGQAQIGRAARLLAAAA